MNIVNLTDWRKMRAKECISAWVTHYWKRKQCMWNVVFCTFIKRHQLCEFYFYIFRTFTQDIIFLVKGFRVCWLEGRKTDQGCMLIICKKCSGSWSVHMVSTREWGDDRAESLEGRRKVPALASPAVLWDFLPFHDAICYPFFTNTVPILSTYCSDLLC